VEEFGKRRLYNPQYVYVAVRVPAVIGTTVQQIRKLGTGFNVGHFGFKLLGNSTLHQRVPYAYGRQIGAPVIFKLRRGRLCIATCTRRDKVVCYVAKVVEHIGRFLYKTA
jgi:hypothetical protein